MKNLIHVAVLLTFGACTVWAQDGHIDPSPDHHRHVLSIARHPDTPFNLSTASNGLATATQQLQECDSTVSMDQDVAVAVTVDAGATLGSFGAAGDGLDIITTVAERLAVLNNNTARVKVVTLLGITSSGTPGNVNATALLSGSSIIIESVLPQFGVILMHEFGHNQGLLHRDTPGNPLMKTFSPHGNEVNQAEAAAFHVGGTVVGPNRPVDVGFVIDDTGSMSEEIAGVRNALTMHLMTFPTTACEAFQLTTFKDNFTVRPATTNLSTIQGQVSALAATGGGNCPEASVQALNAAGPMIKNNGRVFLATDADPHPGVDISAAIQALRSRGIRVDVILSGTCPTSLGVGIGTGSIEAYSTIARETGGIFAYVPGVNSGGSGPMEFQNTALNIVQGGLTNSIALVEPSRVPAGSTVAIRLIGSGTNFQPGTTVQISGTDITVTQVTVVSPIELLATMAIASGATLGFRDVTATTDLGGGAMEVAQGTGPLQILPPAFGPTVASIAPPSAEVGSTVSLTVFGTNTNFGPASVLDLGSGINVQSTAAVSATELIATVQVSPSAAIGFRNVTVTTGSEVASENLVGPFFVSSASSTTPSPAVVSVQPSMASRGSMVNVMITGQNTSFSSGASSVSFSGSGLNVSSTTVVSSTSLMATVSVAPDAALGFRDVFVTTGSEVAVLLGGFLVQDLMLPVFMPPTPCGQTIMASVGVPVTFDVIASATNGLPGAQVTLSASGLPSAASVNPTLPLNGQPAQVTVTWTPTNADVGINTLTFNAVDQLNSTQSCVVDVLVAECFLLASSAPISLNLPGADVLYARPDLVWPVTLESIPSFELANDPALVGLQAYFQVLMWNPYVFPGDPLRSSNGLSVTIGTGATSYGVANGMSLWCPTTPNIGSTLELDFSIASS